MTDLSGPEAVIRLWLALACLAILVTIIGCHLLSRTLDHLARRREGGVQRSPGAMPGISQSPAAAPAFDPVSLPSRYRIGSRLARVHREAPHALNAPTIGMESRSVASQRRPKDSVTGEENIGLRD